MLYALGLGRQVVARSCDCDYPPAVRSKPKVVASRVANLAPQDSVKIHKAVLELRRKGLHQFTLDLPALKKLKPDLVITQDLCAVCSASHPEVSAALRQIFPAPKTISLNATRLDQVFSELKNLGAATGRQKAADRLTAQLQRRIEAVREAVAPSKKKPRVWCCEWLEPLMAAGHWLPELIGLAGGTDGLASKGAESRWLSWEHVRSYNPEVIIVMPCSYTIRQTMREKSRLLKRPGWQKLSAVRGGRVFAVETSFFHRAGPRLVDGLELLAHLIHPERYEATPTISRRFMRFI